MTVSASKRRVHERIVRGCLDQIQPSPENDRLYRPVDVHDSEIIALAESISQRGVLEPLQITQDGFILSGHRRYAAAKLAGLQTVPCRIAPIRRCDDPDAFISLLRECNRQREKTLDEKLREEVVSADAEEAYVALLDHRRRKSDMSDSDLCTLEISGCKHRKAISSAKFPMLKAIHDVIHERRAFWPLSDRSIHYALLNDPPLRHASKPRSVYLNDRASYHDLTDLLTRARLSDHRPCV